MKVNAKRKKKSKEKKLFSVKVVNQLEINVNRILNLKSFTPTCYLPQYLILPLINQAV